jgi:catechol-2,3-dioxygenase
MHDLAPTTVSGAADRLIGPRGFRFGAAARLGHVEFQTRNLGRLTDYYRDVLGFSVLAMDADVAYLGLGAPGHAVALRQGKHDGPAHIAFELSTNLSVDDAKRVLDDLDVTVERKQDAEPGIPDLLEFADPEGNTIQLYHDASEGRTALSATGVRPHKLGHICLYTRDVEGLTAWYEETLGFRWSDWIGDFFVFLRLGPDHHSLNLLQGEKAGNVMQHVAYELRDFSHIQEACDQLARHGHSLVWGPGRHGPGHNIFTYHRDPDGNNVELFAQIDIINEELGTFEPRPWHQDNPQRPKRWVPDPLAPNSWGILPPEGFM